MAGSCRRILGLRKTPMLFNSTGFIFIFLPLTIAAFSVAVWLRSPGYWLDSARGVVFVIEGTGTPSNISAVNAMQRMSHNPAVNFIGIAGASHFSVLAPSNEVIARKILNDVPSHKQFEMTGAELQTQTR